MNDPDCVEKTIELRAPRSRVWRAISNAKDFATWFGLGQPLQLEGDFVAGARIAGKWKVDGKEMSEQFCTIERIEPEQLLVFRWVPYELAPGDDPDQQPTTRIEMRLEEIAGGTRLTVVEAGFSQLPPDKQYKAFENANGWELQLHSIAQHVLGRIPVRVERRIGRPPTDVLEAIVDPARMASYFISRGSARMTPNAKLEWEWSDVGAKLDIHVRAVAPDHVTFLWSATGTPTQVTLALTADGDGTKLVATELPFELSEDGAARAVQQTQGWTDFCCSLEAYLVHGINLRTGKRVE